MDIAIYGGSFDPPHIGHERIVELILKKLDIFKLFIIPTYLNPFKNTFHLDANIRLELIKELFKDIEKVSICDFEVLKKEKVSTYETIKYLKSTYGIKKIYLIIGADNLKDVHLWYNANKLKDLVEFIVISRDNITSESDFIDFRQLELNIDISSTKLRKNMDLKYIPTKIQQKVKKLWKLE